MTLRLTHLNTYVGICNVPNAVSTTICIFLGVYDDKYFHLKVNKKFQNRFYISQSYWLLFDVVLLL